MGNAPAKMTPVDTGIESGVTWATCNAPLYGAVNGYVFVPEGNPLRGLDYEEVNERLDLTDLLGGAGELTFTDPDGWIGFDTLHSCDSWPDAPDHWQHEGAVRWTPELVSEQARLLARKVAEAVES